MANGFDGQHAVRFFDGKRHDRVIERIQMCGRKAGGWNNVQTMGMTRQHLRFSGGQHHHILTNADKRVVQIDGGVVNRVLHSSVGVA